MFKVFFTFMPTYDYQCSECKMIFERFHSMTESPEILCESCGASTKKKFSAGSAIVFKGSGFYVTDYKKKADKAKNISTTEKKTEVKTESHTKTG